MLAILTMRRGLRRRMQGDLMNLTELVAKLPEADRAEAETVIQAAIVAGNPIAGIDTKEKAVEFIAKTPLFDQASMFIRTKAIEAHDAKFKAEELPKLIKAEVAKLTGPETDPLKLEVAQMRAEREAEKAELKREKLTAAALKVAMAEGIPGEDVARFLGDDEEKTTESVKAHAARIKAWRDAQIEATLKERLGNVGKPLGGNTQPAGDLESQFKAAVAAGNADMALVLQGKMQALAANKQRS